MRNRQTPTGSLSPPPLIHSRTSPNSVPTFPTLKSAPPSTPRDVRSRSSTNVNLLSPPNIKEPDNTTLTFENFDDVVSQKINDSTYTDNLARLNRVTNSFTQHAAALKSYEKQYVELEQQYRDLLKQIDDAKTSLDKDAAARMKAILPEIQEQIRTMEDIRDRVGHARRKLNEQTDMLTEIDDRIAENRKLLSLPPPSSKNIFSAPPLPSRKDTSEGSEETSPSTDEESEPTRSGWRCIIS